MKLSSLCILRINPLSDIWCVNIFSHSVVCFFISLIMSVDAQKFLTLIMSNLCILSLVAYPFGVIYQKLLCNPKTLRFTSVFLSKNFIVELLH